MPGGDFLLRIHEKFGVDVTWLLTGQRTPSTPPLSVAPSPPVTPSSSSPTPEEAALLADYRTTDEQGRAIIRATASAASRAAHANPDTSGGQRVAPRARRKSA